METYSGSISFTTQQYCRSLRFWNILELLSCLSIDRKEPDTFGIEQLVESASLRYRNTTLPICVSQEFMDVGACAVEKRRLTRKTLNVELRDPPLTATSWG